MLRGGCRVLRGGRGGGGEGGREGGRERGRGAHACGRELELEFVRVRVRVRVCVGVCGDCERGGRASVSANYARYRGLALWQQVSLRPHALVP
jgi:hypothetical protein